MNANELKTLVEHSLAELKAVNVETIDLAGKTDIADYMIVASGTSDARTLRAGKTVVAAADT